MFLTDDQLTERRHQTNLMIKMRAEQHDRSTHWQFTLLAAARLKECGDDQPRIVPFTKLTTEDIDRLLVD